MVVPAEDHRPPPAAVDPYGQAALLLVESLIHALVANAAIALDEAVAMVEVAQEVACDLAEDVAIAPSPADAAALLASIIASLRTDLAE